MIAYLDSSVLLRIVLEQEGPLAEWDDLRSGVSSVLLPVECRRTLDRLWQQGRFSREAVTLKSIKLQTFMARLDLRPLHDAAFKIASQPFPTPLGTLDALHLATAMLYRATHQSGEHPIIFATHDVELARAARAMRFEVIGAPA